MSEGKVKSVPPLQGSKGWGTRKLKSRINTSQAHDQLPARVHRGRDVMVEGKHGFEWVRHPPGSPKRWRTHTAGSGLGRAATN